jgi:uncharacterized protein (DUF697 family)
MTDSILQRTKEKLKRQVTDIESRTDLTDDEKVNQIIIIFSTGCAAIAVQPIPFADFFILTPLQAYMGARISAIRGVPLSDKQSADLVKELMGVVGMGALAQQLGIGAAKLFFPIFGSVATVPVVFGLTFGIGTVMDFYLKQKAGGKTPNPDELRRVWKNAKARGKAEGRARKGEITRAQEE